MIARILRGAPLCALLSSTVPSSRAATHLRKRIKQGTADLKKIKSRSARLTACLLASTAIGSPAFAQATDLSPPPRASVDENGVNLATGTVMPTDRSIAIGSGQSSLEFHRYSTGLSFGRDSFLYAVYSGVNSAQVVAGDRSIDFDLVGGAYVNREGTGETLTGNSTTYVWTLVLRDGTVVQMDMTPFNTGADTYRYHGKNVEGVASTITLPNKRKLTLTYKELTIGTVAPTSYLRIQSVQSSDGLMAKYEYADNTTSSGFVQLTKVTLLNNAVDYCNPSADSCTFSLAWPSLTFTKSSGTVTVDTTTDNLGRTTTYQSNNAGLMTLRRPASSADDVTVTYDSSSRVQSLAIDGRTWTYSWNLAAPLMTATVTNPYATQKSYVTNTTTNQVTSSTDELGRTTTYQYDTQGRMTDFAYPEGNKLHYTYDSRGNVTEARAISKTAGTPADIVNSASYPASCANPLTCNEPTSTTDARGATTDYTYDATHGGVLTVTRPPATNGIRPQIRYGYSALQAYYKNSSGSIVASGQPTYLLASVSQCQTLSTCSGGSDEVKSMISYGPQSAGTANNLLPASISKGSGDGALTASSALTYDSVGNITSVDGPLAGSGDTTLMLYDGARQQVGQIEPDPDGAGPAPSLPNRAVRLTYNADGQIIKSERGTTQDGSWSGFVAADFVDTAYDATGRKTTETLKNGSSAYALTQYSYDAAGRVDCVAQRMNIAVYGSLPTSACTLSTQGSFGPDRINQTVYDAASEPTQLKVAVGTSDAATERTMTYTSNGMLQTLKDGENNLTTYVYDGFDRLSQVQYPNAPKGSGTSNAGDYEQFTYDGNSNVTQYRVRSGGLIGYGYDTLNRRISLGSSLLADRNYSYDLLDRMLTAKFTTAAQGITNTYDALDRLTLTSSDVGGTAHSLSYAYDLAGQRTQTTWWDGFYINYDRLLTGEITKVRENGATTGAGVLAAYAYDNLGNKTSVTFGNGAVQNFTYDAVSRLATLSNLPGTANALSTTFAYNPASQITQAVRTGDTYAYTAMGNGTTAYASNGLHEQVAIGGSAATWDGNGNVLTEPQNSETYSYDIENKLTSSTSPVKGSASMGYDPLNRLDTYNNGTTRRFVYDGDRKSVV